MLVSLTELKTYRVEGTDGDIGRIDDLVVPQNEWIARYIVVTMEDLDRSALLLTASLGQLNRRKHTLSAARFRYSRGGNERNTYGRRAFA